MISALSTLMLRLGRPRDGRREAVFGRFATRRLVVSLSLVIIMLVGLGATMGCSQAQDATSDPMSAMDGHPVVCLWRTAVANEGDTPFTSLSTFHADGTYTEVLPDGLVLSGVWRPTGERVVTVTGDLNYFIDDRPVTAAVRLMVEVDETGTELAEEGTLVGLYEDGSVAIAIESPATGTRPEVLPEEPLGTPVLPSDLATAGMPTP